MMAVPTTTDAMTIRTVVVVFCIAAFFCETSLGAAEGAASTELVTRTTVGEEVGRSRGVATEVGVVKELEVVDEDEELETTLLDDVEATDVVVGSVGKTCS